MPDGNLIKNVWGIIVSWIYANRKQFASVNELKVAIKIAWYSFEEDIIKKHAKELRTSSSTVGDLLTSKLRFCRE